MGTGLKAGDIVQVAEQFRMAFPDIYKVESVNGDIYKISGGNDFHYKFLDKITLNIAGLGKITSTNEITLEP